MAVHHEKGDTCASHSDGDSLSFSYESPTCCPSFRSDASSKKPLLPPVGGVTPPLELLEHSSCKSHPLLCSVLSPPCAGPGGWNAGHLQEVGGAGPSPAHLPAPPLWAPARSPHTHVRLVLLPVEDPQQRRVLVSSEVQCDVVDSCNCRERGRGWQVLDDTPQQGPPRLFTWIAGAFS